MKRGRFLWVFFGTLVLAQGAIGQAFPAGKRVVMVIASKGFRDEELLVPKDIFERQGIEVTVASTGEGVARGALAARITPDARLDGRIITANGPLVAKGFALALRRVLGSDRPHPPHQER